MTNNKAIQKRVSDGDEIHCGACVKAKLTAKISRASVRRGNQPFNVIHCDVIYENLAYNNARYYVHFYDSYSQWQIIYNMTQQNAQIVQSLAKGVIKWTTKRGFNVLYFHSDGESALKNFDLWL